MIALAAPILVVLLVMAAIMTLSWAVQRAEANAGWTDVFWTFGTGASLALAALATPAGASWRAILVACLAGIWSLRLSLFLTGRMAGSPEDTRYAGFRRAWGAAFQSRMFGLSLIQAPASAILAVSVVLAGAAPGAGVQIGDIAGVAIFTLAVAGETLADAQLKRFKAAHRGRVCDEGLWAWSRHPNYFFEWIAWFAYPAIAIRADTPWSLASLAAPALMFALLRFGSGVPPLEAAMLSTRGDAYRRYQARVSPFILLPPRRSRP